MKNVSQEKQKKWTVMVYLAGDNDLNDDMMASLKSLHALRGNPGCNIFAYYATSNLPREAVLYDFRESTTEATPLRTCERRRLGTAARAVRMGDSADIRTLVNFVKGCRQVAQTEYNVLILSGHSDAFLGRSLLKDETSMRVLSFGALKKALHDITDALNGPLDILGFDSCVMGMVEIAYELRKFARVLVAPQDFTPSSGWNYQEMLHSLVRNPKDDPAFHAKSFIKRYVCFQRDFAVGGRSVELGACDLEKGDFKKLIGNIRKLADLLRVELPPVKLPRDSTEISRLADLLQVDLPSAQILKDSTDSTIDLKYGDDEDGDDTRGFVYTRLIELLLCSHWFSQTHMQDQSVDLCHFCFNLFLECAKLARDIGIIRGDKDAGGSKENQKDQTNPEVTRLLTKLQKISDLCVKIYVLMRGKDGKGGIVIHNDHAGNLDQFSFGLSLFFPWSRLGFVLSYDTYKRLAFAKGLGNSWLSLINRITVETMRQDIPLAFTPKLRRAGFPIPLEGFAGNIEQDLFMKFEEELSKDFERYDPPGKGALAAFRERFGKVKNYPMKDLNEPDCGKQSASDGDDDSA